MWLSVASSLRAFNTVQCSGMPNLRMTAGVFNVLKKLAAGLFRLSAIFNTKRVRITCAHDTYHWPKELLPWIQMSRFSGDAEINEHVDRGKYHDSAVFKIHVQVIIHLYNQF